MKKIFSIIAILSLVALIFSVIILLQKATGSQSIDNFCSTIDPSSQCDKVQQSVYSQILGIPNPVFGIFGFSLMIALSLYAMHGKKQYTAAKILIIAGGMIAGLMSLWFLYLQIFVLHAYCVFCLLVDASSLALLGVSVYLLSHNRNAKPVGNKKNKRKP